MKWKGGRGVYKNSSKEGHQDESKKIENKKRGAKKEKHRTEKAIGKKVNKGGKQKRK